jgi:two-component system response regulator AlgR
MAEAAPLRVMVVDDEPLAVERLELLLARCPGVAVVGTAGDGEAALRIAEAVTPDLVLLDIAMPGMDGIDVARALSRSGVDAAVVFVTAFDNFAVAAFDVAAIDYLMKPVQTERLARALDRARAHLAGGGGAGAGAARPASAHVEEFWVPDHSGLVRIAASDIQRITAERDYMRLHVGPRSWLIHRTIAKLEEDLDPALFLRVHRSVILRRDTVAGLYRDEAGHWTARLADGAEQRIGRSYVDDVKRFAGR